MTERCPTPRKIAYQTRDQAISADTKQRRRHPKHRASRPYQCACGAWHLTSQPKGHAA